MGAPSVPQSLVEALRTNASAAAQDRGAVGRRITLALDASTTLDVPADGTRIVGVAGSCWLTMHHDLRDVIVEPGTDWVVHRRHSPVVLTGLAAAGTVVVVVPPAPAG